MAQIRAITSSNLLDISEKIKQILCERARDKIVRNLLFVSDRNFLLSEKNNFPSGKYEKKPWIILDMSTKKNVSILELVE